MFFLKRIKLLPKYDVNVSYQGDIILIKIKWYRWRITMYMYEWMWLTFSSLSYRTLAVFDTSVDCSLYVNHRQISNSSWSDHQLINIHSIYIDKQKEIRTVLFILSSRFLSRLVKNYSVYLTSQWQDLYEKKIFFSTLQPLINVVVLALKRVSLTTVYVDVVFFR